MSRLALVLFLSLPAVAAPKPRIAVIPIQTSGAALPADARPALLSASATRPVQLASSFEVDEALAVVRNPLCATDEGCLALVARMTRSTFALGVLATQRDTRWELTAKIVDESGRLVRDGTVELEASTGWASMTNALVTRVQLESLSLDDLTPLPALALAKKEEAPVAPVPAPVQAAPQPAPVPAVTAQAETPSTWHRPTAIVLGSLAVAAAGVSTTLAIVNGNEATFLRSQSASGLLPANQVERAVALDERTGVAIGIGIGAAISALGAGVLWAAAPSTAPRVSVLASPNLGGVAISGTWP